MRRIWIFAFFLFWFFVVFHDADEGWGQAVLVDPQKKLIPGGPGQEPFDVTRHTVPLSDIAISVPRDAIPALVQPPVIPAGEASRLLKDSDRVLGICWNGEARAYPVRILNWHELVNDEVGGRPVLVSW